MGTINGKLIHSHINQFDEIIQITENLNQRCSHLEKQYLQNVGQEIDSNRSHLQKLEQRIGFLEELTSKQAKQISFLKVSGVIGLFSLWLIFHSNNQPNIQNNQDGKHSETMELMTACLKSQNIS